MDKTHPRGQHCFKTSAIYVNKLLSLFPHVLLLFFIDRFSLFDLFVEEHTTKNPLCSFGGMRRAPPRLYTEKKCRQKRYDSTPTTDRHWGQTALVNSLVFSMLFLINNTIFLLLYVYVCYCEHEWESLNKTASSSALRVKVMTGKHNRS